MPTFVIALTNLIENETKIYFEAAESAVKAVEKTGLIESEFFPSLDAAEEAAGQHRDRSDKSVTSRMTVFPLLMM